MLQRVLTRVAVVLTGILLAVESYAKPIVDIDLEVLGSYSSGVFDQGAAEIAAYDAKTQSLFVINSNAAQVDVIDISNPYLPTKIDVISVSTLGGSVNSVAVKRGLVAVAVAAENKQDSGLVAFYRTKSLDLVKTVVVGALPDMLVFSPDGRYVLVANEGEPNDDYTVDPEGSVTIIDLNQGVNNAVARTADFKRFIGREDRLRAKGIRIFGPGANAAQDFEPEFITVSADSKTAWVALQENNALAVINIRKARVKKLLPLGTKDHSFPGNEFDASNKDGGAQLQTWPVQGFFMPDSIDSYHVGGRTFIVTANEGDSRDYDGFSEEARVADLTLDMKRFPDSDTLQESTNLGRLKVTMANGDIDGDGDFDVLYSFGARSFSIFDQSGRQVFDSGSHIELTTATQLGANFNSCNDENDSGDSRSDDKGPEPEAIELAKIFGATFAFVGLERVGGIMVYDISDPNNVRFINYVNNRNFNVPAALGDGSSNPLAGDLGVECLLYIPANKSPILKPLLVSANEVSGTTTIFEIQVTRADESLLLTKD